ncbi:ABC transporter permease [Nonomuraea sp. H19]|uniref:ABC transporter permease n=1 Tax=Nonomuraea sp. H19 TaxID=3452206 RepID=UPI003F8C4161
MSAVWSAARAAVRRRRVQSVVLGVVVFASTLAIVVALALLEAASAPFNRAFAQQRGAHVSAVFDPAKVSGARLAQAARRAGVEAVAGPFGQAVLTVPAGGDHLPPGPLTVVGRADPGGPVDRVNLWSGRWAARPGEIVLNWPADPVFEHLLGARVTFTGGAAFTVVGLASTVSQTAQAWVSPDQVAALRPSGVQMLYRFTGAATDREVRAGLAAVTAGLPDGSLLAAQSYVTIKQDIGRTVSAYLPFLMVFGGLGLAVAVLIVANVVSGAVVAGFRHIGILKSLGFTPNQVIAVYLTMVLVPAVAGCALATLTGGLAARPLLHVVFQGVDGGDLAVGVSPWVYLTALLGVPAAVVLAALVPALRAHRLPAARAISAGSAPRAGRGRRVQRRLAGARLPRSIGLGLGLPFARPGRSALTLAAVVLGVTTVTLATGLSSTMAGYGRATQRVGYVHSIVYVGTPHAGQVAPGRGDAEIEKLLRALPGALHVTATTWMDLGLAGYPQDVRCQFLRGDSATLGHPVVKGRWATGPGEVVATSPFLSKRGLAVGDRLTLALNGRRTTVSIVGQTMDGHPDQIQAGWHTLETLAPGQRATQYEIRVAGSVPAYNAAVRAAEPGLYPSVKSQADANTVAIISAASILTLLLGAVAALGVFNTVVLDTRERRRDLGMLKSIGMTPRQVTVMVVTSMAALGAVGGLVSVPIGITAHRLTVLAMTEAASIVFPPALFDVWRVPVLALLALAGVAIAVLGAFVPARSAARLTIANVLHNE